MNFWPIRFPRHPVEPRSLVIDDAMQGFISVQVNVGGREYPLFVATSSGNITRRGTPLATSAVENNFLGFSWLVKAVLTTESLSAQVQGAGKH